MAKLKTPATSAAYLELMAWAPDTASTSDYEEFIETLDNLIRTVKDETELALMRGKVHHLGEPHMLHSALTSAVGLCHRPVQRIAIEKQITAALEKYLGLKFRPPGKKRMRRKLLPHA